MKELQTNVGIVVEPTDAPDSFIVRQGRASLSILIENMRREGFELQVQTSGNFPRIDGKKCEPIEHAIIDVDAAFVGVVMEKLGVRKGSL